MAKDVQGTAVSVLSQSSNNYISVTDIARHKEPDRSDQVIQNWMRNRNTIRFLGIWERLNNVSFKPLEFEGFKIKAGLNRFVLTPRQRIDTTHAKRRIDTARDELKPSYPRQDRLFHLGHRRKPGANETEQEP